MTEKVAGSAAAADVREPSEDGTAGSTGSDLVEQAIRRFQDGTDCEGAFRVLYDTYFQALQRFFAGRGVPPEDRLDLTQETFLGIYKGLEGYEDRQRFTAWLYRVATTIHLKWLRKAATAKRAMGEVSLDGMENPDATLAVSGRQLDDLLAEERRCALRAAVAELPEQMRDCVTLRLHGLSCSEIATVKKISIETVKSHLRRAREKLQEKLADFALGDLEV